MPAALRTFRFEPTPAVSESRSRDTFIPCPVCSSESSDYLFHKKGIRFVRCPSCKLVYVNPTRKVGDNYFDIAQLDQHKDARDRELLEQDVAHLLSRAHARFVEKMGRAPKRSLLVGRYLDSFLESPAARALNLEVLKPTQEQFEKLALEGDTSFVTQAIKKDTELVFLNEFLEASPYARLAVRDITKALPEDAWILVQYANIDSLPARMLRRYWPYFFDRKACYFNLGNLSTLLWQHGMRLEKQINTPLTYSLEYVADRVAPNSPATQLLHATPIGDVTATLPSGSHAALFRKRTKRSDNSEKLSIIFPVFNEARYVKDVVEALIAKEVRIDREIIIVESNSTDGTREIVKTFEGREGVKILYEDKPRGKGHAVRTGLAAVSGTIILIQDADFEYDLDDYDALLEPILQRKASFVLGSRSLGLDDWKVRKYAENRIKGFLMNSAQVAFAKTFNALYQQQVTDVNTMFKVFRAECLDGVDLVCNGFNLDIELACKIVKNGYSPMEVPVNYVSRSFAEGKKINFWKDAWPSYYAFFRYRFGE